MSPSSRSRKDPINNLLAAILCFALLLSTFVLGVPRAFLVAAKAQEQARGPQPVSGPPADDLPNLDDVRRRPQEQRQAPVVVSSSIRSRRKPQTPRNGIKVGDPGTTGTDGIVPGRIGSAT
jgi:hypothetical protein